jgi:hypothetical protein
MEIDNIIQSLDLPQVKTYSVTFGKTDDMKEKNHTATVEIEMQGGVKKVEKYKDNTFDGVRKKVHGLLEKASRNVRSYQICFELFKNPREENHQALIFLVERNGNVIQKGFTGNSFEEIIAATVEYWKAEHKKQSDKADLEDLDQLLHEDPYK